MVDFSVLIPPPVKVFVGQKSFEVSGLTMEHISKLLRDNFDLITTFMEGDTIDFKAMAISAPELVAMIIAMASDAEGQEQSIKKLPFVSQVEALKSIWELTVPDVKKLKELLSGVATLNKSLGQESGGLPSGSLSTST